MSNETNDFAHKKGISPRIFQDHVWTMISEVVAEIQKNFWKIYVFGNKASNFREFFQTLLASWILLDKLNVSLGLLFQTKA